MNHVYYSLSRTSWDKPRKRSLTISFCSIILLDKTENISAIRHRFVHMRCLRCLIWFCDVAAYRAWAHCGMLRRKRRCERSMFWTGPVRVNVYYFFHRFTVQTFRIPSKYRRLHLHRPRPTRQNYKLDNWTRHIRRCKLVIAGTAPACPQLVRRRPFTPSVNYLSSLKTTVGRYILCSSDCCP